MTLVPWAACLEYTTKSCTAMPPGKKHVYSIEEVILDCRQVNQIKPVAKSLQPEFKKCKGKKGVRLHSVQETV